jgi:Protein kinase domain/PEGA domain
MIAVETVAPGRDPLDAAAREDLRDLFTVVTLHRRRPASLVYIARDLADDKPLAVKVMPRSAAAGAAAEDACRRAAAAVALLRHVHVVPLYRSGATRRFFWYAMEYVEGPSLADVLREKGPMELLPCLRVAEQVGSALDYAHRHGVVHANLKPANVLLDAAGWARVTDFSVRPVLERLGALTNPAGGNGGHTAYVAPEDSSERQPGPHADQYALAVLVYESLGRTLPAAEQPLASLPLLCDADPRIPRHVALAVRRALSAAPGGRFPTVVDFVAGLQAPATPMVAPVYPARTARPPVLLFPIPDEPTRISRRRWVSLGAVSLAVAGAAVALVLPGPARSTKGTTPLSQVPVATATPDSTAPRPDSTVLLADSGLAEAAGRRPAVVRVAAPAPSPAAPPGPSSTRPGRLFVNATPWGRIYVDGVLAGNTPKGAISVKPGTHRVRVVREGFAPFEDTIRVESGQDLRLTEIVLAELKP